MFWLIFGAVVALVGFIYFNQKKNEDFWKKIMAMPGPKDFPIVGTEYSLDSAEQIFDNERKYHKLYGPIFKRWSFNSAYVSLSNPEDIELLLTNSKHLEKDDSYDFLHTWLGQGLLTNRGKQSYDN
ncbi:hypothetical protein C4B38_000339 [Diabrotica virgifera virgifera]|uniref:Cytochrome P450 4C1-like n=1 Tax=Diabrotica virgifera virgifera TaxID=50390 RepID=A0A6P7GK27_DIAVI|nr:hypothetical protein C4B38_000339 [Diabrotica virgifera virgifera]